MIPVIDESHALFGGSTQILARLLSTGKPTQMTKSIAESYEVQLSSLRQFYSRCDEYEAITAFGRVPSLPSESPLRDVKGAAKIAKGTFESLKNVVSSYSDDTLHEDDEEDDSPRPKAGKGKAAEDARRREGKSASPPSDPTPADPDGWACRACTFRNHSLLPACEVCETPRDSVVAAKGSDSKVPHTKKETSSSKVEKKASPMVSSIAIVIINMLCAISLCLLTMNTFLLSFCPPGK
jgi:hypothetical protein